ncbi:MAG: hypothetical protein AB7V27_16785 [Candidatus Binatia bacterium]
MPALDLQGVLKALRGAGINVVVIHQHMVGETRGSCSSIMGNRPGRGARAGFEDSPGCRSTRCCSGRPCAGPARKPRLFVEVHGCEAADRNE